MGSPLMMGSSILYLLGLILILPAGKLAQAQTYYQPEQASLLGGEPSWDDTPDNYEDYFPITYVIFGFLGIPHLRTIVAEEAECPIAIDSTTQFRYDITDGAGYNQRATGELVNNGQLPFKFPVQVCSIDADPESIFRDALDAGTVVLSYQNMTYDTVPRVKRDPKRFLLTGDTGLRSKPTNLGLGKLGDPPCNASEIYGIHQCYLNFTQDDLTESPEGSFQGTDEWYFKQLADDASTRDIDVIVYVGDYLYRQGPCPFNATDSLFNEIKNCSGINLPVTSNASEVAPEAIPMNFLPGNFGDNWWGWWADFFWPAMKLLQTSPIIPTRGNHEICRRGGFGYFFFMAPQPLCPDCTSDLTRLCAEANQPYAVPFEHEQFLVMDDSIIDPFEGGIDHFMFVEGACPGPPQEEGAKIIPTQETRDDDYQNTVDFYRNYFQQLEETSKDYNTNFYVSHRPLFGIACNNTELGVLDWTLQQSLGRHTLDRVSALINGHMHWHEALKFKDDSLPTQLVVGNGGTKLIPNYIDQNIWPHVRVEVGIEGLGYEGDVEWGFSNSEFGYSVMERNDETLDYEVSFYFLNRDTKQIELYQESLAIPKGPRVPSAEDNTTTSSMDILDEESGDNGGGTGGEPGSETTPTAAPTDGSSAAWTANALPCVFLGALLIFFY